MKKMCIRDRAVDLAIKQINEYPANGMLLERNLPYHAYNVNTKEKLGLCGWGRGVGWYSICLLYTSNNYYNTKFMDNKKVL